LFDATFTRADDSRLTTPSIVTDVSIHALTIAFGNADQPIPDRSGTLARRSAVPIGRQSLPVVSSTGTAFPCARALDPPLSGHYPAFQ
jgi:hypothetical protein